MTTAADRTVSPPTVASRLRSRRAWWPVAAAVAAYLLLATHEIRLPGVYMDAVNPDYLVARVLNRHAPDPTIAWVLPGNYLGQRYPLLVAFYHGTQPFWLGLPLYALLGTDVLGIRLTHAAFGVVVLVATLAFLRAAGVRTAALAMGALAFATDPALTYAFRTQSHITLLPCAWLMLSLACLATRRGRDTTRTAFAGFFYGLAVQGYFVFAFFLPAMLWALLALQSDDEVPGQPRRAMLATLMTWALGVAGGCAGYLVGYALVADAEGGLRGFARYFAAYQAQLHAFPHALPIGERIATNARLLQEALSNGWHQSMMFGGATVPTPGAATKAWLLLALPLLAGFGAGAARESRDLARVLAALSGAFFVVALAFAGRLGGHHFIALLPVAYAGAAVAAARWLDAPSRAANHAGVVALALLAATIVLNLVAHVRTFERLAQTRGVGLMSDAINRLADDLASTPRKPLLVAPDWGLAMPVILMTRAEVPVTSEAAESTLRAAICDGRDVWIAPIGGDRGARIAQWHAMLGGPAPAVTHYRQGDGAVVFDVAMFAALERRGGCEGAVVR